MIPDAQTRAGRARVIIRLRKGTISNLEAQMALDALGAYVPERIAEAAEMEFRALCPEAVVPR